MTNLTQCSASTSALGILYHRYEDFLKSADPRVADLPLMFAFWPTLTLTFLYVVSVVVGPKLMADKKPLELRLPLFLFNAFLVAVNIHIFTEVLVNAINLRYSIRCQPLKYGEGPSEIRLARAIYWFYISKLFEFGDTIFFILRKKNNQISFLHVYHHATMLPMTWMICRFLAGGQSYFLTMINSFVHVVMYCYYGLAALGPSMQKYLWWKKYITKIQLTQFVISLVHGTQAICTGCEFPHWMIWISLMQGAVFLILFLNSYTQSYRKPSENKTNRLNGVMTVPKEIDQKDPAANKEDMNLKNDFNKKNN